MATAVIEARERLVAKQTELSELFKKGYASFSPEDVDRARTLRSEADELGKKWEDLRDMDDLAGKMQKWQQEQVTPVNPMQHSNTDETKSGQEEGEGRGRAVIQKSLGQLLAESEQYKQVRGKSNPRVTFEIENFDTMQLGQKATLTTTAGFAPEIRRNGRVLDMAMRRPVVADLIPQDPTGDTAVRYMEETTFTNASAPVAENAAKPESALAWTERTIPVEVIATWIPITQQQLDDVAGIQGLVNNRLTLMLQLTEENQLLNGSGVSPNLLGFYNKPGILTQAKATDPTPDAFYKAFTKVRNTGFADPTGIVMHPDDWTKVRLLRTADGVYIWGNPSEQGPERMWGVPVIQTTAATVGTGLTGDFQLFSHISRRQGIRIDVTDSHADFFQYNKLAIRIEERLSLEIYRATAFCLVTGINV